MEAPGYEAFRDSLEYLIEANKLESSHSSQEGFISRIGGLVLVDPDKAPSDTPIAVIGDIHGDYSTFKIIRDFLEREGAFKGLVVFLGDYIDRGEPEQQVAVLYDLYRLKKEYLERLVILRGNHEPPRGLEPYPHDYPYALRSIYGYSRGRELYDLSRRLFDSMPHALVIKGRAIMVHGGLPTRRIGDPIEEYLAWDHRDPLQLEEILWNDPSDHVEEWDYNPRGAGRLWGPIITSRVFESYQISLVVRAHEAASQGYKFNHQGRVLTIFSRLGPPYFNEKAAILYCDSMEVLDAGSVEECIHIVAESRE